MDSIDKQIAGLLQSDAQLSSAQVGAATGLSVSAAGERVRRMTSSGTISAWRAVFDPASLGLNLLAFVLVDMRYQGETEAKLAIASLPEVQEIHHISGAHSYLVKIRVPDTAALQQLLQDKVKPLEAVTRTESIIVLETVKETSEVVIR
jgi:Lrp/AsnC family transcriptional regulator, leucine-responsive regulatory protein